MWMSGLAVVVVVVVPPCIGGVWYLSLLQSVVQSE